MVELVDAVDSKSTVICDVGVQVPPRAPSIFADMAELVDALESGSSG